MEEHLTGERSVFSQLRTDVERALKHAFKLGQTSTAAGSGGGEGEGEDRAENKELAATSRTLDETLSMAKWKAETALKALRWGARRARRLCVCLAVCYVV